MNKSTKNWSTKKLLVYNLLVLFIFFFTLEISFRVYNYLQWDSYETYLSIQGSPRLISDSTLIWNNRPFYLEFYKESQYNELGMRMPAGEALMPKKAKDDFWVFTLGGSAMAGMGSNINGELLDITNVFNHPISSSIDGYLELYLKDKMPDKNVKVFNAAISSTSIVQSMRNYERLKKYNPDWIITLDGVNEPRTFKSGQSINQQLIIDWENDPSNNFPISFYTYLTRKSAFLNTVKKYIFFLRLKWRRNKNDEIQQKWINWDRTELVYDSSDKYISNAVDTFLFNLESFRKILSDDKQKHLIFIQPHLSLRDTNKLKNIEKGVYNYYTSLGDSGTNQYYKLLYRNADEKYADDSSIFLMNWVHESDNWAFVDYCHFTKEINSAFAEKIGHYMLYKDVVDLED